MIYFLAHILSPLSVCAAVPRGDYYKEDQLYLVKALCAVPADLLQVGWLKQKYDITAMFRQTIKRLPHESVPDACATWARLCWVDWCACSHSHKKPDHAATSAPEPLLWQIAAENDSFASVFRTACTVRMMKACWHAAEFAVYDVIQYNAIQWMSQFSQTCHVIL